MGEYEVKRWWKEIREDVITGAYKGLEWDEVPLDAKKEIQDMWDLTHTRRERSPTAPPTLSLKCIN